MPRLTGILETALYVEDLERSEAFYARLLGVRKLAGDERFRALEVGEGQVLLLFLRGATRNYTEIQGSIIPPHDGAGELHLALAVPPDELDAWQSRLEEEGVPLESRVEWPRGGASLFFRDPDRHLIELATPDLWPAG